MQRLLRFFAMGLCAAVISTSSAAEGGTDANNKVWRVGCDAAFAPFTFTDSKGELIGFDVDLIRAMGKSRGVEVSIKSYPFDSIIPTLITDNIDLIISGFTITPERAERVDFSDPYYRCGLTFLTLTENADKYKTLEDLKDAEICVQLGTSGAVFLEKAMPNAKIKRFNSPPETYLELIGKGCVAVLNDRPVNDYFMVTSGRKDIVSRNITTDDSEYYGIAMRKGDKQMVDLVNKALKDVQENGEFERISKKWFGYDVSAELKEGK